MACFWLFVSHLLFLLLTNFQITTVAHALEFGPALPEYDLSVVVRELSANRKHGRRHVVVRAPQVNPTTPATETPTTTSTTTSTSTTTTTSIDNPQAGQNTTYGETPVEGDAEQTYDQPVRGYEPSVGPIEDNAEYPNYDGQVTNNTDEGRYQYQILINADVNGELIDLPEQYMDEPVDSMLACSRLCNMYNDNNNSTAACQAVTYFEPEECYLFTNLDPPVDDRYTYSEPGGIVGLLLRTKYPAPTETSPPLENDDGEDDDDNDNSDEDGDDDNSSDGGVYTTTTTTTTTMAPGTYPPVTTTKSPMSRSIYSKTTIMPTDAYGKTVVNIYYSACPTY